MGHKGSASRMGSETKGDSLRLPFHSQAFLWKARERNGTKEPILVSFLCFSPLFGSIPKEWNQTKGNKGATEGKPKPTPKGVDPLCCFYLTSKVKTAKPKGFAARKHRVVFTFWLVKTKKGWALLY